jgi:hypothetical protein
VLARELLALVADGGVRAPASVRPASGPPLPAASLSLPLIT